MNRTPCLIGVILMIWGLASAALAEKVVFGEYAAHDREKHRNTLRTAIAEAAGMTGFERNGDVVRLASYAPLLARRGHTPRHPDLIYFTGTDVWFSANYYVQQMFACNSGDTALEATVSAGGNPATLAASAVRDSRSGDLIVKMVNGADTTVPVAVRLDGLSGTTHFQAVKTVLTGSSPDATNDDGQPPVVKPESTCLPVPSAFDCEVPANGVVVLRLKPSDSAGD